MLGWIILGLLVVLIIWVVVMYNSLVTLQNQVQNAWQQIDVQLKRRHDLIPNLLNTIKGAMEFERDTLSRVIEARARAVGAATVSGKGEAENMLTQALSKLFALVENYPDLKSNQNILQFQEELTSTENRIGFARQFYNDIIAQFNIKQGIFPSNIIAALFGFKTGEYFQADTAAKEVPKVDLSLNR